MKSKGENLIFLISQPRAGSTLLQMILGRHPKIHTLAEPWLLLPVLYQHSSSSQSDYDHSIAKMAIDNFLNNFQDGKTEYYNALRNMYNYLYSKALENTGKKYFLDKTPRYYFIIREIFQLYPDATFLILFRNPLYVFNSIITNWVKTDNDFHRLKKYEYDLLYAPKYLLEGKKVLGKRAITICYEDYVNRPEKEIGKLCKRMNIEFYPEMIDYRSDIYSKWMIGDSKAIKEQQRPTNLATKKLEFNLQIPQLWRLYNDYIEFLGEKIIEQMGYDFCKLKAQLKSYRPSSYILRLTYPLMWFFKKNVKNRRYLEKRIFHLSLFIQNNGINRTTLFEKIR